MISLNSSCEIDISLPPTNVSPVLFAFINTNFSRTRTQIRNNFYRPYQYLFRIRIEAATCRAKTQLISQLWAVCLPSYRQLSSETQQLRRCSLSLLNAVTVQLQIDVLTQFYTELIKVWMDVLLLLTRLGFEGTNCEAMKLQQVFKRNDNDFHVIGTVFSRDFLVFWVKQGNVQTQ